MQALGAHAGLLHDGVSAGVGVMELLPVVFGKLLPVHTVMEFPWRSVLAGLGTGLLTTLLFCLPPLLDVRGVRPVLVLRRLVEPGPEGIGGWFAFYNDERPHQALGYRTPRAVFNNLVCNHVGNAPASLSRCPHDYRHNSNEKVLTNVEG